MSSKFYLIFYQLKYTSLDNKTFIFYCATKEDPLELLLDKLETDRSKYHISEDERIDLDRINIYEVSETEYGNDTSSEFLN